MPLLPSLQKMLGAHVPGHPRLLPRLILWLALVALVAAVLSFTHALDHRQVLGLTILGGLILGMVLLEDHRLAVAALAVGAILAGGLLSPRQAVAAAGLDVILFLLGTFLVAGYLEHSLFFEHLASQIVRRVGPRPQVLLAVLMLCALIASAVVGEVAAILFVGGAMVQIAAAYKLRPIPFLIMIAFATNTGSAASAFGPVGITIAIKAHLSVLDFFRWALPIALAVLGLVFVICRWWFARDWQAFIRAVHDAHANPAIADPRHSVRAAWTLVLGMVTLLVLHAPCEHLLGMPANTMLLTAALGAGAVAMLLAGKDLRQLLTRRIDWATLAFFLLLFVIVGALQAAGITHAAAQALGRATQGHPAAIVVAVGWTTGLVSAVLDNMLAVAAFVPLVADLQAHGTICPPATYWLMLFGACFMGNMTSIGSTCNIIACGMADKGGHGTIYFRSWLKIGIIVSVASMALATLLLALQTHALTR